MFHVHDVALSVFRSVRKRRNQRKFHLARASFVSSFSELEKLKYSYPNMNGRVSRVDYVRVPQSDCTP